ncbi:MAG: hypothetical protein HYT93_02605 [Parcubacteria group bacterium]|nr:hypothetical protein [Parcubacteria group bacterium]
MARKKFSVQPPVPKKFKPPVVEKKSDGVPAFHAYDWYFNWMKGFMKNVDGVFLVPCAATKPIYTSTFHRRIYQPFGATRGKGREILVVSEPVVLIRYQDLYDFEKMFLYEFHPKMLSESRELFVNRLRELLSGKHIVGCLPSHHAKLIDDAVGGGWKNYWDGNMYSMVEKGTKLARKRT